MRIPAYHLLAWVLLLLGVRLLLLIFGAVNGGIDFVFFAIIGLLIWRGGYRRFAYGSFGLAGLALLCEVFEIHFIGLVCSLLLIWSGYRLWRHIPTASSSISIVHRFHQLHQRFLWDNLMFASGISDVKIDFSRAILLEGENTLVISGLLGDLLLYVPADVAVSVHTTVMLGKTRLFTEQLPIGFHRQVCYQSEGYEQASKRLKISLSFLVADVDVKQI